MPATTRSSTRQQLSDNAFESKMDEVIANLTTCTVRINHRKQWTVTDQRMLIRMCRHTEMTPASMAVMLGRSEESIRYRLARLIHEHLDGRTDDASIREVSDWFLPN
jgi:hypothetical protein